MSQEHDGHKPEEERIVSNTDLGSTEPQAEVGSPDLSSDFEDDEFETYTPEQRKVTYTEELQETREPKEGESLEDAVAIIRESYSTITEILKRQETLLERQGERERKLMEELRKRGRQELTPEEGSEWFRTLLAGLETAQTNQHGEATLGREGSEWVQVIDHEGSKIRAGSRKQRLQPGGSKEDILAYMSKKSGIGTTNDVPLVHSGLWLRFKMPSLADKSTLQYQILQMKVDLGSATKGQAYSNLSQTTVTLAVDFALRFVIEANVNFQTPSDLKEMISVLDYPILLWGLARTFYPQGFPYAHPCVADPKVCNHISKAVLNINALLRIDRNALTKTQKKLLAEGFKKQTPEALEAYRNEHIYGGGRKVWFGDFGLALRVPNLMEYEESGRAWIDNIVQLTQGAFNEPPHGTQRKNYITSLAYNTSARQYTHWVTGVYEQDEEGERLISDDSEVVEAMLESVFSSDEYIEDFLKAVRTYMDDSLISMIAVSSFNCEACNTPAAKTFKERFEHLLPIDVLSTFFTLVDRKLN